MEKDKKNKNEFGERIEELLIRLGKEKKWSYAELLVHLKDKTLTEKDIRKWEIGLKYPDLDMVYQLSEVYRIPSEQLLQAKNNSYEKCMGSINKVTIKWICYFLDVSIKVGTALAILLYIGLFIFALLFFTTAASQVRRAF